MSQRASILNTDLRLRAEFPTLETRIYELGPYHHVIVVPREQIDAGEFAEEFDDRWRMIGDHVELRNSAPSHGELIPSLADHEIGNNLQGIFLNDIGFRAVLEGMFPQMPPITSIRNGQDHTQYIGFATLPEGPYVADLCKFLDAFMRSRSYEFEVVSPPEKETEISDPKAKAIIQTITGLSVKPIHSRAGLPEFVKEEEYWWFEKLPKLVSGEIAHKEIFQHCGNENESACYLHSAFGHQIDIRQILLAYDVIYMEPPLTDGKDEHLSFWSNQIIQPSDLLRLIEAGRVRFIHSQAEERGDLGFLGEAKTANPAGVLGRRKTAALMMADIVETANEYIFSPSELRGELVEVIHRLSEERNAPIQEIAKSILFPEHMRRICFEPFNDRGLMGLLGIGQGELFASAFKRVRDKDIGLEAHSFGQSIHIAHMLDATFIPALDDSGYVKNWLEPSTAMGDRLNFYRSFNTRIAAAWVGNEQRKIEKKLIVPAIPLFDFRSGVSIEDILQVTQSLSTRTRGQALVSRISALPDEQRDLEVSRFSDALADMTKKQASIAKKLVLTDAAVNIGAYAIGASLFPFSPALLVLQEVLKVARKAPTLDRVISAIELAVDDQTGRNADLTFLSKISRIAEIRTG